MTATIPGGRPADMRVGGAPDRDIVELVRDACQADPDRPALIFEDGVSVSRGRLWAEIESFAGYREDDRQHKVRLSIQVGIPAPLHQDLVDRSVCRGWRPTG